MDIGQAIKQNSICQPNKVAIKDESRYYKFRELNSNSNRLANALLNSGLKKGDKIAALFDNCYEFLVFYIAAAKSRLVAVPINTYLEPAEINFILKNSDSKAVILSSQFANLVKNIQSNLRSIPKENYIITGNEILSTMKPYKKYVYNSKDTEPAVQADGEDIFLMIYTSGTTGKPKGCLIPHDRWVEWIIYKAILFGAMDYDVLYLSTPFYHSLVVLPMMQLFLGGTVYLTKKFHADKIFRILQKEVTILCGVPTVYYEIAKNCLKMRRRYNFDRVRIIITAGASMHYTTKEKILKLFPNAGMFDFYGSTETGMISCLRPQDQLRKPGSVGQPVLPKEVKLLDDNGNEVHRGEIGMFYINEPPLMKGYYKDPEATDALYCGKWVTAGDMGRQDNEGYYYIVDRKIDMIISGGVNIYPAEIENIIRCHDKVYQVAVIGVPDEKWGEAVKALIVPNVNKELTEKEILDFCQGRISRIKIPKSVDIVSSLPLTASGKIHKSILRKKFWENHNHMVN